MKEINIRHLEIRMKEVYPSTARAAADELGEAVMRQLVTDLPERGYRFIPQLDVGRLRVEGETSGAKIRDQIAVSVARALHPAVRRRGQAR